MKVAKLFILTGVVLLSTLTCLGFSDAKERASRLGIGMNVSYLDQYWLGKKENQFADFASETELRKRLHVFGDIKKNGFQTVRIPVNFGAWATIKPPYSWKKKNHLKLPDLFINEALRAGLNVIIDLHHVEFDGSIEGADDTARLVWLWKQISERYKNLDPERVFFELRNEPKEVSAEDWRNQANAMISAVRGVSKKHTLVVGFHDWNSRAALIASKPFGDKNIIYTFHFYDPFLFTHQGATWAGDGLSTMRGIPFPANGSIDNKGVKSSWVKRMIRDYRKDTREEKITSDLKEAKKWSIEYDVPIFLGEFGSFGKYASPESRCRHAKVVYSAVGKLKIPNAWWEWDGGFNMFEPKTTKIQSCMKDAIASFGNTK